MFCVAKNDSDSESSTEKKAIEEELRMEIVEKMQKNNSDSESLTEKEAIEEESRMEIVEKMQKAVTELERMTKEEVEKESEDAEKEKEVLRKLILRLQRVIAMDEETEKSETKRDELTCWLNERKRVGCKDIGAYMYHITSYRRYGVCACVECTNQCACSV